MSSLVPKASADKYTKAWERGEAKNPLPSLLQCKVHGSTAPYLSYEYSLELLLSLDKLWVGKVVRRSICGIDLNNRGDSHVVLCKFQ
jgi:hypothetical protein